MDKFCRGCLVRYEEPTELLQYTEKNRRLFVYCTGIQVKRTDTFTFQLCKACYLNMKVACNFKKQCRNSDKLFTSYLGLKEEGIDLSTFLKNNDDSWAFRFPGNVTPSCQRVKDEDNESTNTSIRNFMMDMMPEDDLPDTEARIIKEVIDEEADVMDDSLDSHWLQDDASIDTDFKLDFSLSPFSSPRAINDDRYTPKKQIPNKATKKTNKPEQIDTVAKKVLDNLDMPLIDNESNHAPFSISIKMERDFDETMDSLDVVNDFLKHESDNAKGIDNDPVPQCTIDRNLEEALKNTDNKEFSLDELLVSPNVIPGIKAPATPFINNILFGDKLDLDENSNNSHKYKAGHCIEAYENVRGDVEITNEFTNPVDIKLDELDLEKLKTEMIDEIDKHAQTENQFDITNFYCNMCEKKFKSLMSLQRHAKLEHQFKIRLQTKWICDFCGWEWSDRTNFLRHLQIHMRPPKQYYCDLCKMEFCTKNALKQHRRAHMGDEQVPKPARKRFLCLECGASTDKAGNFRIHMMRHEKKYSHICPECQKGFYRKAELTIHIRYHTGEKPFPCSHCDMRFARRDCLTRHLKKHLDLKPYQCEYCKNRYVNSNSLKKHLKTAVLCVRDRDKIASDQMTIDENGTVKSFVTEEIHVKEQKRKDNDEDSATESFDTKGTEEILLNGQDKKNNGEDSAIVTFDTEEILVKEQEMKNNDEDSATESFVTEEILVKGQNSKRNDEDNTTKSFATEEILVKGQEKKNIDEDSATESFDTEYILAKGQKRKKNENSATESFATEEKLVKGQKRKKKDEDSTTESFLTQKILAKGQKRKRNYEDSTTKSFATEKKLVKGQKRKKKYEDSNTESFLTQKILAKGQKWKKKYKDSTTESFVTEEILVKGKKSKKKVENSTTESFVPEEIFAKGQKKNLEADSTTKSTVTEDIPVKIEE